MQQAQAFGRFEAAFERLNGAPAPARVTQAPPPMRPVKGGANAPRDIHSLAKSDDASDYIRARRAACLMAKNLWTKGQSGNPLGRPKKHAEITKLAQSHSVEAMERLVELKRNKKAGNLSLKACEIILERAFGRVPYAVTGEGGEGPVKIAYEVSWRHAEDGGVTLDLKPNKDEPPKQT